MMEKLLVTDWGDYMKNAYIVTIEDLVTRSKRKVYSGSDYAAALKTAKDFASSLNMKNFEIYFDTMCGGKYLGTKFFPDCVRAPL